MQYALFSFKFNKYLALIIVPLFISIISGPLNANENTIKNEEYYYETLRVNWGDMFPDGNRNAAGPRFFKYLIDQDLDFHDFVEFNKRYCPVSGSLIRPGSAPDFISMIEESTNKKSCRCIRVYQ